MSTRKAFDADIPDDVAASSGQALMSPDLSNIKTTPKVIATALLALLPPGATKHDAAAKKLLKAYALLTAELDARSNVMARVNESEGARHPIAFRFLSQTTAGEIEMDDAGGGDDNDDLRDDDAMTVIHMPEECFLEIMAFLNGREIVNASEVNKAWLYVSRMPVLWERLDALNGLSNRDRKMNQTTLLALLGRPQFANLKFLALPYKVKLGRSTIASIAKMCPHLETWDVGYSKGSGRGKDSDLMDAVEKFNNLTSIGTNMWDVTSTGISSVVRAMGANLLNLRIDNDCICSHYLHDGVLTIISEHCPNLKHFAYKMHSSCYKASLDWLTGAGVRDLVRGCRRLEILELERSLNIERADFETILNMVAQDPGSFALRKIDLIGYPFVIRDNPLINDISSSNVDTDNSARSQRRQRQLGDHPVVPTERDILHGRGRYNNAHPGNIHFREEALRIRSIYERLTKEEKYGLSLVLVETMTQENRRFLKRGTDGQWYEVNTEGARYKASQALRERLPTRNYN